MSIANDLLHALHDVVQTLPSSLDLSDVVTSTQETIRQLVDSTVTVVLVPDDTSDLWRVELAEGVRLPETLLPDELPRTLVRALDETDVVLVDDLDPATGGACGVETRSVLATALRAHDRVVGLVSIEHRDAAAYTDEDARLIAGLASSLALAVDNARWFSRLRTLGAEAERARIARDLHDRVAQSLAYIGFELDRLAAVHDDPDLQDLQGVVRGVVGELRETLFQLRANVSENQDLVDVARDYISRWSDRTGVETEFSPHTGGRRVPVQVEQELWRILQESLTNVERHADASHAWVSWRIGDGRAQLEVRDDGRGMTNDGVARERYGLVGIRERADAVGAQVTLMSEPTNGTTVLVELEVAQ
jgi:signal transduction histidine kinase